MSSHENADELENALSPLFNVLRELDATREHLEQQGGTAASLRSLTSLLRSRFVLSCGDHTGNICLAERPRLTALLSKLSAGRICMDVRNAPTAFIPLYYICRLAHPDDTERAPIVQDLYRSPGYPMEDPRFIRLGIIGRHASRLRVSAFREGVQPGPGGNTSESSVDSLLDHIARWVLGAAWHEAQRPAFVLSDALDLNRFRQAIELLHLAATAEPATLRAVSDARMVEFFTHVYPHAPICHYLRRLDGLRGERLDLLPHRAAEQYDILQQVYAAFLSTPVEWGITNNRSRLWEVLYGNISRFGSCSELLRNDTRLCAEANKLEAIAEDLTWDLLST